MHMDSPDSRDAGRATAWLVAPALLCGAVAGVTGWFASLGVPGWGLAVWVLGGAGLAAGLSVLREQRRDAEAARLGDLLQASVQRSGSAPSPALIAQMGLLGTSLAAWWAHQEGVDASVVRLIGRLEALPEQLAAGEREVTASGAEIEEAVEETASLIAHINSSIRSINAEVDSLSQSSEEASASILEMSSANEEVARISGSLHGAAEASTQGVHEISASIRQVAESADAVQAMAEESAAAMVQMDRAIQEVSTHVEDAAALTGRVSAGAEEGTAAVGATIDGIAQIRVQTQSAKQVLERLASRIAEIGEIVNVIGSINDETNLLSLNAAIIAAQAGEQGKAFAVVANHVKTLAQRTASSTQEIAGLISAVQEESGNAVTAMAAGIESVETGVARSRKAGEELARIRESAGNATARVAEISRATTEQSRNSKHVAEAAQQTSSMVQQISSAMGEQSRASDTLLRNAEESLELCRQVKRSTEEQRESGRFINESINAIGEMVGSIQQSTSSHGTASDSMSSAVSQILDLAQKRTTGTRDLRVALDGVLAEARDLADPGDEPPAS